MTNTDKLDAMYLEFDAFCEANGIEVYDATGDFKLSADEIRHELDDASPLAPWLDAFIAELERIQN